MGGTCAGTCVFYAGDTINENSSEQVIADLIGHSLPVRNDLCGSDASDLGQTWQSTLFPHG